MALDTLKKPLNKSSGLSTSHAAAIDMIQTQYQKHFSCQLQHSLPYSLSQVDHEQHQTLACTRYQPASEGDLFLEQYLDEHVEDSPQRLTHDYVSREEIVEIGGFAVGRALPHAELRINAGGEIEARGSNMLGYLDADGFVFVTGRIKNVFITSLGRNVNPEEELHQLVALANAKLPDYARSHAHLVMDTALATELITPNGRLKRQLALTQFQHVINDYSCREHDLSVVW
jgi:hypothetical protein